MKTVSIDEAGRGPVLGPLVMCGVLTTKEQDEELKSMGIKDSKLLTPKKREELFDKVLEVIEDYRVAIVHPPEIDNCLNSNINLTKIESIKSADMLNELKPDKAILDCPSINPASYLEQLRTSMINKNMDIIAEHKADVNYVSVGAASIIAKVIRDREIEKIKAEVKVDIGSGYPSDPVTKKFLKTHYMSHQHLFRNTWKPHKKMMFGRHQKDLGDF